MKTVDHQKSNRHWSGFRILSGHEYGMDPCPAIQNIAAQCYGSSSALPVSLLKSWYHKSPAIFTIALASNNTVAGYISALPLFGKRFDQTINPDFNENSIAAEDIDSDSFPAEGGIFISSIAVAREYQGQAPVSLLLRLTFIEDLIAQHPGDEKTIRITAQALSPKGEACMGSLGMRHRSLTNLGWKVFYGRLGKRDLYFVRQELKQKLMNFAQETGPGAGG